MAIVEEKKYTMAELLAEEDARLAKEAKEAEERRLAEEARIKEEKERKRQEWLAEKERKHQEYLEMKEKRRQERIAEKERIHQEYLAEQERRHQEWLAEKERRANTFEDRTLTCKKCGNEFVWSASEQRFFKERGFFRPSMCKDCKKKERVINNFHKEG